MWVTSVFQQTEHISFLLMLLNPHGRCGEKGASKEAKQSKSREPHMSARVSVAHYSAGTRLKPSQQVTVAYGHHLSGKYVMCFFWQEFDMLEIYSPFQWIITALKNVFEQGLIK